MIGVYFCCSSVLTSICVLTPPPVLTRRQDTNEMGSEFAARPILRGDDCFGGHDHPLIDSVVRLLACFSPIQFSIYLLD